jgi:hypothetical protein
MVSKITLIVILLSAVSLIVALPQHFQFTCGLIQLFLLPGLVFCIFVLEGRISRPDQIFLSIIISPLILSLLTVAVNMAAGDFVLSAKIILAVSYVLLAAALVSGRHARIKEGGARIPKAIFLVSISYAGLVLLSFLINDYLLIRSDSWYHAAVVSEVMTRGIPPREPLLADVSIKYMWFYHLFQALWIRFSGMTLFKAMGFFNIINAFLFPCLLARFAAYFTRKKYLIVLAALFAIAGLDSASWILWPIVLFKAFIGEVTGMAEIRRIIEAVTLNGAEVIQFLKPMGTIQVNWSDKFLTITVFNYALNLFLTCLILVLDREFLKSSRSRSGSLLFVIILGTFLFHVVTGATLLFILFGSTILTYVQFRFIRREKYSISEDVAQLIPALIAVPIAAYYFMSLTSVSNSAGGNGLIDNIFHIGFVSILTIVFPLIILFYPARAALKKLFSGSDYISKTMIGWILCLIILSVFVNIGTVGEKKFIYFLFLVIGTPIYIQIVEKIRTYSGARKILLTAAILILFVVPPLLTFRGFMMDEPREKIDTRRYNISDEDRAYFEWMRENTPKNSVIIENNIYHLSPVYASRRNFYSWYGIIRVLDYSGPKMETYRSVQESLFNPEEIHSSTIEIMRSMEQELYIAIWREDIESSPWLAQRYSRESRWFREVYSSQRVSLYSLKDGEG